MGLPARLEQMQCLRQSTSKPGYKKTSTGIPALEQMQCLRQNTSKPGYKKTSTGIPARLEQMQFLRQSTSKAGHKKKSTGFPARLEQRIRGFRPGWNKQCTSKPGHKKKSMGIPARMEQMQCLRQSTSKPGNFECFASRYIHKFLFNLIHMEKSFFNILFSLNEPKSYRLNPKYHCTFIKYGGT